VLLFVLPAKSLTINTCCRVADFPDQCINLPPSPERYGGWVRFLRKLAPLWPFVLGHWLFPGQTWPMSVLAHVAVHSSLIPENVQRDLLQSLRARRIDPKFHYASYKQSQKWLALHEVWSPSRIDADCAALYDCSFLAAAGALNSSRVRVIGLGCGGGQKDARLLGSLAGQGREISYTPCDISLALVLTAYRAARTAVPGIRCDPLVCDLAVAEDLPEVLHRQEGAPTVHLITFFGMIPNFEPEVIMPRLAALLRPGDLLLFSANLAPGPDYAAGVQQVLPGYDNPQTRDWLLTFLLDLGVEPDDGFVRFSIEDTPSALKRIVADFCFTKERILQVHGERFEFREGDKVRLFFSYRYTPSLIASLFSEHKLAILSQWITASGEEGVFLCGPTGAAGRFSGSQAQP
jgi:L-histidine Nalpha-methyltransferase